MPNYKGHVVGGCFTYLLVICIISHYLHISCCAALEWLICSILGSLFPDIDTKSKGQKIFYRIIVVCIMGLLFQLKYLYALLLALMSLLPMLLNHRGLFHSLWFNLGCVMVLGLIGCELFPFYKMHVLINILFFFAGIISHLWLDLGLKRMLRI